MNTDQVLDLTTNRTIIEKSSIGGSSRSTYYSRIISVVMFFFDSPLHHHLISEQFLHDFHRANEIDKNLPRHKSIKREVFRAEIKKVLKKMKRSDNLSSPIKLKSSNLSDRVLTYEDIVAFMETKKKKEKVNKKLAQAYKKKVNELNPDDDGDTDDAVQFLTEETDDGEIIVAIRQEAATYDGIRSAITFLYTSTGNKMNLVMQESLSLYIKGSRRLNILAKQTLGLDITEGKKPMTRKVYKKIAEILFRSQKKEHLFTYLFLVLEW